MRVKLERIRIGWTFNGKNQSEKKEVYILPAAVDGVYQTAEQMFAFVDSLLIIVN